MDSQSGLFKLNLITKLLHVEAMLGEQLTGVGCRFIKSPERIRARLESMSIDELAALLENLSNYSDVLKLAAETDVDPWNDADLLILAMRKAGLQFPNDFLDVLMPNHVVEAYDMNRRQIFRNLYFIQLSNYSLLELLSYEWPMLFHRDPEITNIIIRQAEQDMWAANYVIRAEVPVHYIRELLCENPQICKVQQQYFAPLFSGPDKPGGALAISFGQLIGPDKSIDRESLSFIC